VACVARCAAEADLCLVEGVMGLFDGRDGRSEAGSTAQLAKWLGAPVILVVDAWTLARSAAALVAGFASFDPGCAVAGVVLNKTGGASHTAWLRDALDAAGSRPALLGGLPRDGALAACMAAARGEAADGGPAGGMGGGAWPPGAAGGPASAELAQRLGALVEEHLDLDALLALAAPLQPPPQAARVSRNALTPPPPSAPPSPGGGGGPDSAGGVKARIAALSGRNNGSGSPAGGAAPGNVSPLQASPLASPTPSRPSTPPPEKLVAAAVSLSTPVTQPISAAPSFGPVVPRPRLGVARDAAFCLHYAENLAALVAAGADLVFFSPCSEPLPSRLSGVIFGSGAPDAFAPQLAANSGARAAVAAFAAAGGVVIAEGAGVAYLCSRLVVRGGPAWPMTGVLPAAAAAPARALRVGYAAVAAGGTGVLPASLRARGQLSRSLDLYLPSRDARGVPDEASPAAAGDGWAAAYALQLLASGSGDTLGAAAPEGWARGSILASFVQLHFGSAPGLAAALVQRCREVPPEAALAAAAAAAAALPLDPALLALAAPQPQPPPSPGHARGPSLGERAGPALSPGMRRVPSLTQLGNGGAAITPRFGGLFGGGGEGGGGMVRAGSFSIAPGGLQRSNSDAGSVAGSWRLGRSLSRLDLVGGWGGDEAAAGGQYQWAVDAGPALAPPQELAASAAPQPFSGAPRELNAPFFAILRGEVLMPHEWRLAALNRAGEHATVVSLLPAATEVLFALGVEPPRLAGVSDLCDYPPHARAASRVVSRSRVDIATLSSTEVGAAMRLLAERREPAFALDAPWLAAAAPDVVVTQDLCTAGGDVAASVVARALTEAGLLGASSDTAVLVLRPRTLGEALEAVAHLGSACGAAPAAAALTEALQARLRAVAAAVAPAPRRPRILSLEGLRPLVAGGHWLPEMKALAGGADELQEAGAAAERLRWETVLQYAPDVLLVLPCNPSLERTLGEVGLLAAQPGFWALQAVKSNQVYILDHARFSRPGPRLVDGVEALARILHPDLVTTPLPAGAAMRLCLPPNTRCRPHQLRQYFQPFT
jgi:ABC-type Fe3+-hydroxamate transport system substrate-binding protein